MSEKKDVNTTSYSPLTYSHKREGRYPANWGSSTNNSVVSIRQLSRSTGVWKRGMGRKPEQAYVNSTVSYSHPKGTLKIWEDSRNWHVFSGQLETLGFQSWYFTLTPSLYGGAVKSFPTLASFGVNPDMLSQAEVKAYNTLDRFSFEKGDASVDLSVAAGERRETASLLKQAAVATLSLARAIAVGLDHPGSYNDIVEVMRRAFRTTPTAKSKRQLQRYLQKKKQQRANPRSILNEVGKGALISTAVADIWLTHRLAVSPLMSELGNLYDISQQHVHDRDGWFFRVSARHYVERSDLQSYNCGWGGYVKSTFSARELHGYTVTFVAAPVKKELDRMAQLGFDSPLSTAWELTTLSFVIDYFVNIGDFLSALNVPKRFEFIDGSYTQRIQRLYGLRCTGPGTSFHAAGTADRVSRSVYTTFPVPIPPLSLSGQDLTIKQDLTLAALAVVGLRELFK